MLMQQNQRINVNLRERVELVNKYELNIRNMTLELEGLRRNKSELEAGFSQRLEYDKM